MRFRTADVLDCGSKPHHGSCSHILQINIQRLKQKVCALLLFSISVGISPPPYTHLCCCRCNLMRIIEENHTNTQKDGARNSYS